MNPFRRLSTTELAARTGLICLSVLMASATFWVVVNIIRSLWP